jgi:hypothetical protein
LVVPGAVYFIQPVPVIIEVMFFQQLAVVVIQNVFRKAPLELIVVNA